jgi:hypothetical protein
MLSSHCVITEMQEDVTIYKFSTHMALNFMLQKGILMDLSYLLVGNFPFVGYYAEDREFERVTTFIFWHFINRFHFLVFH